MPVFVNALIKGLGWKIGLELGSYVARRMGITNEAERGTRKNEEAVEEEEMAGEEPGADTP